MMAPSLVLREGRPRLVVGSAGSARLRGAILQIVVNVVGKGMGVEEAVDAPRLHAEEGVVYCEDAAVADRLEAAGREVVRFKRRNLYFGGVSAVEVLGGGRSRPRATRAGAAPGWSSREPGLRGAPRGAGRRGGADAPRGRSERRAGSVADLRRRRVAKRRRRAAVSEGAAPVSPCRGVRRGGSPTACWSAGCRSRATRIRRAPMSPTWA